jgi:uncharacterized protein with HEPN domain
MQPEALKYAYDVHQACKALAQFVEGRTLADYGDDLLLRSGVERQLIIVGEALQQALRIEPELEDCITDIRGIIGLRHVLVHGYGVVEDETLWGIVHEDLPTLRAQVERLLAQ